MPFAKTLAVALAISSFASIASPPVLAATPATKPVEDADLSLVRAAIVKAMPKVKADDVTPAKSIADLGGRDIEVISVLSEIQIALTADVMIDDDAVEKMTNTHASKKMSDLTVQNLVQIVKDARAAAK